MGQGDRGGTSILGREKERKFQQKGHLLPFGLGGQRELSPSPSRRRRLPRLQGQTFPSDWAETDNRLVGDHGRTARAGLIIYKCMYDICSQSQTLRRR